MKKSVYTRPNKPRILPVTKRDIDAIKAPSVVTPALMIHASTECHVTPPNVADQMAAYLGHVSNLLEPSCGTGNLINAAIADNITAIEKNYDLCKIILERTGIQPICSDFLEYEPEILFDGVLMNPPFSKARHHVGHAIDCLCPGGKIIALVPVTFKNELFNAKTLETLTNDTFAAAKVFTKIIRMTK